MDISIINFAVPTGEGFGWFLTQCIAWLCEITSSIAVGVILFTVILKLITLPFDAYSRISMRKNSMKMEEMRPELEKLQRQYAGDKNLYNQKMMALYKKNGYSMMGACLPTIVTLVIFIIAINAFTDYSRYQNRMYVHDMSVSYNQVIYDGIDLDNEYISIDDGKFNANNGKFIENLPATVGESKNVDNIYVITREGEQTFSIYTPNGYTKYYSDFKWENDAFVFSGAKFTIIEGSLNGKELYVQNGEGENIVFNYDKMKAEGNVVNEKQFIEEVCATASAETFRSKKASFLWVKNIWVTDSPMAHPIDSEMTNVAAAEGCASCGCSSCNGCDCSSLDNEGYTKEEMSDGYAKLISKMDKEKTEPNGYFILVVLTAGSSLLLQLITSKSQKAQMELQTVDGQGAQQQKMMTWMMPIMMAVFAFMYTAAFSIYIVLSSIISIGTTLLINFILDKKYKKVEGEKKEVVRGRIYIPKEEEKTEPTKKDKKSKKNAIPDNDFLSGKADKKKHIRGRLK